MDKRNELEVMNIDTPGQALELLYRALELAQTRGVYTLNDANKIHLSLQVLVKALQEDE